MKLINLPICLIYIIYYVYILDKYSMSLSYIYVIRYIYPGLLGNEMNLQLDMARATLQSRNGKTTNSVSLDGR